MIFFEYCLFVASKSNALKGHVRPSTTLHLNIPVHAHFRLRIAHGRPPTHRYCAVFCFRHFWLQNHCTCVQKYHNYKVLAMLRASKPKMGSFRLATLFCFCSFVSLSLSDLPSSCLSDLISPSAGRCCTPHTFM